MEEGKPVEANLLVTKDPEVWKEIQHLWNAYVVNTSLTVATVASATSSGQTVSVWWDLAKQHSHKPFRTKVELRQATQTPGPVPIKAKAIDLKIDESARPVTVRILAPEFYRRFVPGVQGMDNPQTIISEVAQMLGCRTATLCGGNWQVVQHKHGTIVIGHVKVAPDLAQKLVPLSGKRALFFTKVDKQTKSLVAWISRAKETTAEDYFNHAWTQAQNKKLPLVLRQGGNNDLGIAGIAATDLDQNQPRSFQLLGAPRYWNHEDILVFLKKTQWKDAEIKDRLRRGPEVAWIFKAVPAPLQNSDDKGVFWQFCDSEGICTFTITPERHGKTKKAHMEWLKPPNKNWNLNFNPLDSSSQTAGSGQPNLRCSTAAGTVPATLLDSTQSQASQEVPKAEENGDNGNARGRSPRRKQNGAGDPLVQPGPSDPKDLFLVDYPGRTVEDPKGQGDCGFCTAARAVAYTDKART